MSPELIETTWGEVECFDCLDEGRVVIMRTVGRHTDPGFVTFEIATPRRVYEDPYWFTRWRDIERIRKPIDEPARVVRGLHVLAGLPNTKEQP